MIKSDLVTLIDDYGDIVLSPDEIVRFTLEGQEVSGIMVSDEDAVSQYNHMVNLTDRTDFPTLNKPKERKDSAETHLKRKATFWRIPTEYLYMDIVDYLVSRCKNDQEKLRVAEELLEFEKRKELDILKVMVYVVDKFRENNVVWGVGRGSSVSCFCLYLIGLNKINPMMYDIPYTEFFKE